MKILTLIFALLLPTLSWAATLHFDWPPGWQLREPVRNDGLLLVEGRLPDAKGNALQSLKITALRLEKDKQSSQPPDIRSLAQGLLDKMKVSAKESNPQLTPIEGKNGYYFQLTDAKPKAGEFNRMMAGVILQKDYLLNFTLLNNSMEDKNTQAIAKAIATVSVEE
ncbi:MAG: hypothetical protein HPY82_25655 [Gammaproteobacteria bacterium]|nr:hypothetical protein [Gammaproteobacteria bacterium]